jgi:hypothetical protein
MKNILFILTALCTYSCKKVEGPVNFDVYMNISVISKQNSSDLLNPTNPKKLDISQVKVSYPPLTQTYSIEANGQNGQAHLYYGSDGKYYIRFYPAANFTKQADVPKILFAWPDKSEDLVEATVLTKEQTTFVFDMYLNDTLVWNADIEKSNATKRPPRSITVMK